jgi:hypothetical protein
MRYARARASWKAIANQGQHDDQQKSSVEAQRWWFPYFLWEKPRAKCVGERIKLHLGDLSDSVGLV